MYIYYIIRPHLQSPTSIHMCDEQAKICPSKPLNVIIHTRIHTIDEKYFCICSTGLKRDQNLWPAILFFLSLVVKACGIGSLVMVETPVFKIVPYLHSINY